MSTYQSHMKDLKVYIQKVNLETNDKAGQGNYNQDPESRWYSSKSPL